MNNPREPRVRLWIEVAAAPLAALAALLTLIDPAWVEAVSGAKLDRGNGSFEAAITVSLTLVAIGAGWLARLEWRRAAALDGGGL